MSFSAVVAVKSESIFTGSRYLVLLALAFDARPGGRSFVTLEGISHHAHISISTVRRALKKLADAGVLRPIEENRDGTIFRGWRIVLPSLDGRAR